MQLKQTHLQGTWGLRRSRVPPTAAAVRQEELMAVQCG